MKLNTEEINKNLNLFKNSEQSNGNAPNGNTTNGNAPDKPVDNKPSAAGEQQPPADLDINTLIFNRLTEYQVIQAVSRHNLCQPVYAKYRVRADFLIFQNQIDRKSTEN